MSYEESESNSYGRGTYGSGQQGDSFGSDTGKDDSYGSGRKNNAFGTGDDSFGGSGDNANPPTQGGYGSSTNRNEDGFGSGNTDASFGSNTGTYGSTRNKRGGDNSLGMSNVEGDDATYGSGAGRNSYNRTGGSDSYDSGDPGDSVGDNSYGSRSKKAYGSTGDDSYNTSRKKPNMDDDSYSGLPGNRSGNTYGSGGDETYGSSNTGTYSSSGRNNNQESSYSGGGGNDDTFGSSGNSYGNNKSSSTSYSIDDTAGDPRDGDSTTGRFVEKVGQTFGSDKLGQKGREKRERAGYVGDGGVVGRDDEDMTARDDGDAGGSTDTF